MADAPTFQIPKDVIEPIIQSHISAAVAVALQGHRPIVEQAVAHALNVKVDNDGKVSQYSSSNQVPWLQWVMGDCIRKAALAAVQEELAQQQDAIKKQIAAELRKVNSPLAKKLIESMAGAIADQRSLQYRLTVSVESDRR